MGSPLRTVFHRISGCATSWKSNRIPRCRRMFHREVEEREEFPYASTHCLSSYYSIFVARLAIMVMLAVLIGLLTILTWHFTRVYTTKSINTLAYGLRFELLQRPILRMCNILNSTVEITTAQLKLSEYVIRRYSKPSNQAEQLEMYEAMRAVTWALFASRKALTAITISYKNGFVQAFHRDHRSNNTFYIYTNLVNYSNSGSNKNEMLSSFQAWDDQSVQENNNISAVWYQEPLDPDSGEKIGKPRSIPPDDLISIAGLSQVPDGVASWHVRVSKYTDSPLLSAALPVWDASNESIMAVVGVTTALYSVGQLMKELVEFHSGYIYLTSQEGYLLATSTNAPLLKNSTMGTALVMAASSEDQVIRLGAQWIHEAYGNKFPPTQEVHVENAKLGHQQYYIDSFFLNLKRLPLVGVIIIPRKYIMGKVDQRAFKTLVILISASVCILFIGCVCILILTNGVSKEMKLRAELISHLDARRRAEASSNYKSQFLANMSHELRTPMAAVIGLLDILICDDYLTNEQYAMVTQIRKCSTALLRLLNNILDISKIESGKLVLEEAEFDLGRELEGLVDMFSVQCINHNVETVLDLSDDMPKLVRGDSARVVQIFANLISNSIKFTTSGHIILRGWCENSTSTEKLSLDYKESRSAFRSMLKQHGNHIKRACKKENKIIVWFEVDDTGCGIDPSKWESVFESFEQADPSTTRTYGGTGLGLCIVRTLVNQMGGQIKVVKKNGPGTLMRLFLLLGAPPDGTGQHCQLELADQSIAVLLTLNGKMGTLVLSRWLRKHGVCTWEASNWNELTQNLKKLIQTTCSISNGGFDTESLPGIETSVFVVVVDIGLLDLTTDTCKDHLNFLDTYHKKAKFVWMLNHDTPNAIKMELRRRGHLLMVNKPLYKAKMIQIIEDVIKDRNIELQNTSSNVLLNASSSSDASDKFETHIPNSVDEQNSTDSKNLSVENCLVEHEAVNTQKDSPLPEPKHEYFHLVNGSVQKKDGIYSNKSANEQKTLKDGAISNKAVNEQKSLKGLHILLAEDTPVLQRVATIMLEKLGAEVVAVGDGLQAVDALECILHANELSLESIPQTGSQKQFSTSPPFDLILMDCQMPKMDGYEATRAIRKSEEGNGMHIPIVALTAHAMSSDEAKCLEVGMDAYLTKPIDLKLMVSTILSLTKSVP